MTLDISVLIPHNSAVSGIGATGITGRNCARGSRPLVGIWLPTTFRKNARLSRLDGQYGTGTVLSDVASFAFVTRGKGYSVLDHPLVQARLHLPPDQFQQRTAKPNGAQPLRLPGDSGGTGGNALPRSCGHASEPRKQKSPVGVTRAGVVYELFFPNLPQHAFTACDAFELYL